MQVSIDRCYFKGSRSAIAKARRSLEQTRFPAISDSEYVIIRQLSVAAECSQLARGYARHTEQLLASKVNGWSRDAATADCVWFASESDLYACLCRDIGLGHAQGLWFWRQFGHLLSGNVAQQLVRVMAKQAARLPVLIARLHDTRQLPRVWGRFGTQERELLLRELLPGGLLQAVRSAAREVMTNNASVVEAGALPPLLTTLLADTRTQGDASSTDLQLAVALYLLATRPHQLVSFQLQAQAEQLIRMVLASAVPSTPGPAAPLAAREGQDGASAASGKASRPAAVAEPTDTGQQPAESLPGDDRERYAGIASEPPPEPVESRFRPDSIVPTTASPKPADTGPMTPGADEAESEDEFPFTDQWHTRQGGLFYLLNVLNQAVIRNRLLNDPQAVAFPSGWGWLYRLGEAFGLEYERELVRCLARLSGMGEQEFLSETPRLQAASEILDYAEQRYQGFAVWQPALLQKSAHIAFLRPELSISFRMRDLDVELRKSGLDIDPGWVDWLGAMLLFHYRDIL